jgi:hypothetical protein
MAVDTGPGNTYLLGAHQLAAPDSIVSYVQPNDPRRPKKTERISPPAALAHWLDTDDSERKRHWHTMAKHLSPTSLPNILLEHLHRSIYAGVSLSCS